MYYMCCIIFMFLYVLLYFMYCFNVLYVLATSTPCCGAWPAQAAFHCHVRMLSQSEY